MNKAYLEKLDRSLSRSEPHPASPKPAPAQTQPGTLERFYQLGQAAHRRKLSVTDVLQTDALWNQLKASSDQEAEYFAAGLMGYSIPAQKQPEPAILPAVSVVTAEPPAPSPAPIAPSISPVELVEPSAATDLEQEVKLLKMLVNLLEQKVAQPISVQIDTPKVVSSVDTIHRDDEKNITSKTTQYKYEE